ncbi:hypothetical protein A1Q1_07550 [Trichosporon asahii var. asahii CBS 2479]|uniref:ATP-dependent DNA helicase CHL1 n=1 Tax=Trichosporon asahii var. asahii (strain ATCC 90039 / CBS 2479 / JCM 2466 / KCTC 7840 / NBRC 103889/ NCYC 2677 / UAMH 7654) TaxID=1186058 RepID=J6F7E3_TRIAS|nr:hypothetical protein A1Q1_07550 [Trichosporon asahii var. asahii CBS 2479]EJT51272.1 hypothetical protein A1Q1_07550 [Trichosporon asahii var. asahii CBS 2479]
MALDTASGAIARRDDAANGSGEQHSVLPHLDTPTSFPFPYTPYQIQLDLMKTVFGAIEDGKIAIVGLHRSDSTDVQVSSPTGTGKSLTLLTSTLSWLSAHQKRLDKATEDDLRRRFKEDDPDVEKAVKRHMAELRAASEARVLRLSAARERERRARQASQAGAFGGPGKRARPSSTIAAEKQMKSEEEFLPEDNEQEKAVASDGPALSAEVRALLAQLEPEQRADDEVAEEDVPKVYFASRTHSQLRQLTSELLKTTFSGEPELPASAEAELTVGSDDPVSLVPLASRRQLCINDKRCQYMPKEDGPMLDARDSVLATVRDIEDLVLEGKERQVCPYYATRKAVKQAQLVTLPYNLLLQKNAREALGIDLEGQIVVIDEAHTEGSGSDSVNLVEMVAYLKESKLARKVSGFAESLEEQMTNAKRSSSVRHASIAAFHAVEAFLLSLTDAKDDGRIILTYDKDVVLKYVLLNPAERFQEVVERARAIILAGGTMEPLFPGIPRSKFATISCSHVIPKSNLLTQVVSRGPRRKDLEFTYSNRGDDSLSSIGLVPDGVVVFVPSYAFLDRLKTSWGGSGGLSEKFSAKKKIFYEPQTTGEVDVILRDYALAIDTPKEKRTGALMFAVVGGKLSEGKLPNHAVDGKLTSRHQLRRSTWPVRRHGRPAVPERL